MAILRHPDVFAAAAAQSAVTAWNHYDTIYTERYMWTPQENEAGYKKGSAMEYAGDLKGRLMIYYGTADDNVHPNNAMQLIRALQRAGKSFEVRITPPRAGTFMYHTHFDDLRQQFGGLVGALLVLEPGERWDRERDLLFLISDGVPGRVYINGALDPPPLPLRVGRSYRLRLADITAFRMGLISRLVRDSTVLTWRPIAKDGFALPAVQAVMRPSVVNLPSGTQMRSWLATPSKPGRSYSAISPPGRCSRVTRRLLTSRWPGCR